MDWSPAHLNGCAQYDNFDFIGDLYDYLEGGAETIPSGDIFRCLMCNKCKVECPEDLGIIDLIRAARAKWYEENGLKPISFHVDPISETTIFTIMDRYVEIPEYPDKGGEIVYRPGCYATHIHPSIARSSTRLLDLAGIDYWVQIDRPGESVCCAMVAASQGNREQLWNRRRGMLMNSRRRGQGRCWFRVPYTIRPLNRCIQTCRGIWC